MIVFYSTSIYYWNNFNLLQLAKQYNGIYIDVSARQNFNVNAVSYYESLRGLQNNYHWGRCAGARHHTNCIYHARWLHSLSQLRFSVFAVVLISRDTWLWFVVSRLMTDLFSNGPLMASLVTNDLKKIGVKGKSNKYRCMFGTRIKTVWYLFN